MKTVKVAVEQVDIEAALESNQGGGLAARCCPVWQALKRNGTSPECVGYHYVSWVNSMAPSDLPPSVTSWIAKADEAGWQNARPGLTFEVEIPFPGENVP